MLIGGIILALVGIGLLIPGFILNSPVGQIEAVLQGLDANTGLYMIIAGIVCVVAGVVLIILKVRKKKA